MENNEGGIPNEITINVTKTEKKSSSIFTFKNIILSALAIGAVFILVKQFKKK